MGHLAPINLGTIVADARVTNRKVRLKSSAEARLEDPVLVVKTAAWKAAQRRSRCRFDSEFLRQTMPWLGIVPNGLRVGANPYQGPNIRYKLKEEWQSGRLHLPAKEANLNGFRGFESLLFRQVLGSRGQSLSLHIVVEVSCQTDPSKYRAPIAQLDRAPDYESGG